MGQMVGCGVYFVGGVCGGHAGRRWIGNLRFWFGKGVPLGGSGGRHGLDVPVAWMFLETCSGEKEEVIACSC